jgi:hypothetical protein
MKKQQETLKYSILKKNKNPYDNVIRVTGLVNEFTPRDIILEINQCEKTIREIEANVKIKSSVLKNIEKTHQLVSRMKREDLCACYLYYEALAFNKKAKPKLDEIKSQLERATKDLQNIKEQTGLDVNYGK